MALRFLVDTSVVKRPGRPEVRQVVEPDASRGEFGRATICDLEVGYSARKAPEWDQLLLAPNAFATVETTAAHVQRALQVQHLLAGGSFTSDPQAVATSDGHDQIFAAATAPTKRIGFRPVTVQSADG